MKPILTKLMRKEDLTKEESADAMTQIMTGEAGEAKTAAFLIALAIKGETGLEIAACAKAMRKAAVKWPGEPIDTLLDTCGTGGDGVGTINISTLAAITLASLGMHVAKHGNRAVSSTTGSADTLEALGLKLSLSHEAVAENLLKNRMTFLFAPQWHPAMKHAAPVRKALGVRTVFNILGPLTNPAPITHQVVGVYAKHVMEPIAEALAAQGRKGAYVLHSEDGLDELSPSASTHYIKILNGKIDSSGSLSPEDFGFERMDRQALIIKNRDDSIARTKAILDGNGSETESKTIAMNAALLHELVTQTGDLAKSARVCLEEITSGRLCEFTKAWKEVTL